MRTASYMRPGKKEIRIVAREKRPKFIIAFSTTTNALMFNDICNLGRIIPLPPQVRAGCGLAYCVDVGLEAKVRQILEESQIENCVFATVDMYYSETMLK